LFKNHILLTVIFILSLGGIAIAAESKQQAVVSEVLAGDTLRLQGGKILKLAGVNSPPLQSKLLMVRAYGDNAKHWTESLVKNKTISIEWGPQIRDDHGDLIGYVFTEDNRFVNLELLREGHGKPRVTPPNVKYSTQFRQAAVAARREKKGLWKEEPDNPFIKEEYIGEKNTKVYYLPDSPELSRIPQAQLVTFRSKVEAKAAGYKPCPTCKEDHLESWGEA
jgi:endonuclease YncB( thermonuclease family)